MGKVSMGATRDKVGLGQKRRRILIVDDHPLARAGLAEVLEREPDLEICAEAEDRFGALEAIPTGRPELAIVDLALKKSHGLELIKDIRARHPEVRVLVVSMHDDLIHAERALRAGAAGYISKEQAISQIVQAVRHVLDGEVYLCPQVAQSVVARMAGHPRADLASGLGSLTDRELQVFELIGEGLSRQQIAERLNLDVNTVETHRSRIRQKLQLKDAQELLQCAIRAGRSQEPS